MSCPLGRISREVLKVFDEFKEVKSGYGCSFFARRGVDGSYGVRILNTGGDPEPMETHQ